LFAIDTSLEMCIRRRVVLLPAHSELRARRLRPPLRVAERWQRPGERLRVGYGRRELRERSHERDPVEDDEHRDAPAVMDPA